MKTSKRRTIEVKMDAVLSAVESFHPGECNVVMLRRRLPYGKDAVWNLLRRLEDNGLVLARRESSATVWWRLAAPPEQEEIQLPEEPIPG